MNPIGSFIFKIKGQTQHLIHTNTPAILTALGISGTISTAYLAGKASYKAALVIFEYEDSLLFDDRSVQQKIKDRAPIVWRLYIPTGISGVATITCIVAATKVGSRRTAAVAAAYSITEKAFEEYREKVTETIGENREKTVRDKLAQGKVDKNPPSEKQLLLAGPGNVLCCELFTGRYFNSDMESLRKAQNNINAKLLRELYASLSDFYYMLGVPYTSNSSDIGWTSDRLMELYFSTVLTEDGRPCITIEYNYTKPL